jgi:hypothetical protein
LKILDLGTRHLAAALAVYLCMFKSEDPNKPCWMSRSVDMRDLEGRRTLKSIFIPTGPETQPMDFDDSKGVVA